MAVNEFLAYRILNYLLEIHIDFYLILLNTLLFDRLDWNYFLDCLDVKNKKQTVYNG